MGAIEFADDAHAVAEVRVEAVGAGSGVPVEMYATRDAALQATAQGDD